MNKRKVILFSFSILCMYLFAGSASAAVDFPADEAGISAYVKAKDSIDLLSVKSALTTIERETPDYIIGTVAMSGHTEEQYPHVYVSTDGWIVAYYPNDRPSSWLLPWRYYSGGSVSTTTLKETIAIVTSATGGTTTGLKYYDFRYPNATKMMFIIESTSGIFKITIPTSYTVYKVDWSHYCSDCYRQYYSYQSYVYLDGIHFNTLHCDNCQEYGSFGPSIDFTNGIEHTVQLTANADTPRIGLVLEYEE